MTDKFQPLITSINEGKIANVAIEFMENELRKLYDMVDARIFVKLNAGSKLTYEELAVAFSEKHAYHKLIKAMKQTSRKGESAGGSFKKLTEEKDNGNKTRRTLSQYRTL